MSWFTRSGSLRGRRNHSPSPSPQQELDANACFTSFKIHWHQAWEVMSRQQMSPSATTKSDHIRSVMNHMEQMVTLLLHDLQTPSNSIGPLLDFLLIENVLEKLLTWSTSWGESSNFLKLEQLKLYETLLSHSQQQLLVHKPILQPLLKLLSTCGECAPVEVEKRLVILLNQLCVSLAQDDTLLDFFFTVSSQLGPSRFLIFSLLIPFVHREGGIGQQARDALLLCMAITRKNESIGMYIAEHSNFCPVLATGLSGLYSVLPRKLIIETEDWHRFTAEDINDIPELVVFMNSFQFCNAVVQVSYPLVQEQLLEYLYQGFLVPVLGPALHQTSEHENIAATAYLDLFVRHITEPALQQTFLKFIFTESYEGSNITDSLILRIGNQSRLCLVTLALFHTLIDLNCEDVMLHLVFRYLMPCNHVMVSQRCRVRDLDMYCKTAEKFLSLIPACCQPDLGVSDSPASLQVSPVSENPAISLANHRRCMTVMEDMWQLDKRLEEPCHANFLDYLQEADRNIQMCNLSCRYWMFRYDGAKGPVGKNRTNKTPLNESEEEIVTMNKMNGTIVETRTRVLLDNAQTQKTSDDSRTSQSSTGNSGNCTNSLSNSNSNHHFVATAKDNEEIGDATLSASSESVSRMTNYDSDDESAFWNVINHCETPPLVDNCEVTFREIEAALEQLAAHNYRNRSQPLILTNNTSQDDAESTSSPSSINVFPPQEADAEVRNDKGVNGGEGGGGVVEEVTNETTANEQDRKISAQMTAQVYNDSYGNPDIGPFLSILLTKLENMMQNTLYINLQLTGLIARLACYPQPLLRSFLLNHTLVFQPTVRSLLQVLGSLKHKLDSYSSTIDNFADLLERARKFLTAREHRLKMDIEVPVMLPYRSRRNSSPDNRKENRKRSFTDILFRRQGTSTSERTPIKGVLLEGIPDGTGYRYINRPFPDAPDGKLESLKTKNAVLCAVVLEEFLTELAAITQEHAVIQTNADTKTTLTNGT